MHPPHEAGPGDSVPAPRTVPELLRDRNREGPGAVALAVDGGASLSYGRWELQSNAVARGLVARGVGPGDRVVLRFDNARWCDYAVAYLAVHKAGAVAVPLGSRLAGRELQLIAEHCQPAWIVGPPDLAPDGLRWRMASGEELADGQTQEPLSTSVQPEDLAEILYTSGTTGHPKGVALSHENVLFYDPPPEPETPGPGGRASFVHSFPIGTNAGQEVLRVPLRRGDRTAIVLPVFSPERFCALVAEHGVRRLQLVPAMAEALLSSGALSRHNLTCVERVTLSSAPSPPALLERLARALPHAALWNTYALTEAGTARTLMVYDGSRAASVGRGVGGTEVRIADDVGRELAAGQAGEVWLRRSGAPVRSYYRDPDSTAAVFSGGWVRTGDLGYLDEAGFLYLTDRKKDLVITGGLNVSSLEVENVLCECPAVADAAVFGLPHAVMGQVVAAAVVVREPMSAQAVQAFVQARLADYKIPQRIFFVDSLPRNPSGKVIKRELRDRWSIDAEARRDVPSAEVTGTTDELLIISIWEEVLGSSGIRPDDDFFAIGGQSLAAAQIVARLNDAFGLDLSPGALFESPTVADLARAVEGMRRR